jgi:RecB family exonuclease
VSGITNGGLATPGPYKVSNSEIQTFKDCKRRWWFSYYRRLKPKAKRVTGPLALGTRVHAALDDYYTNETDLLDAYNTLMEKDRAIAEANWLDITELESEGELGRIMLEGYLDWMAEEGIDSDLEMISTEEIISMPMFGGEVELQGKLDMRVRRKSDGVRMFRDFKTVGTTFEEFASTAHMNEQILTYMLLEAAQNKEDDRSEGGIFTLLKKVKRSGRAKPPFYEQIEVRHNVFTLRAFWQRIHGVVSDLIGVKKALDAGTSHLQVAYPHPTKDCRWKCSFYAICPMVDDGSAVEQAIDQLYEVSDPYDYYADGKEQPKQDI